LELLGNQCAAGQGFGDALRIVERFHARIDRAGACGR
jgi:hypothetical protein